MQKFAFYILSHKALFSFVKELLILIDKFNIDELGLNTFISRTRKQLELFGAALSRDLVDPYTEKVNKADQKHDSSFIGFKTYVEAASFRQTTEWKEAAALIDRTIDRYSSDLYRMAKDEQSAALLKLFDDLRQEPLLTASNTIQSTGWINEMISIQEQYNTHKQEQLTQVDDNTQTLKGTRKPLEQATRSLLKIIELQQEALASPDFDTMVRQINNLIGQSMSSARLSKSLNYKADIDN